MSGPRRADDARGLLGFWAQIGPERQLVPEPAMSYKGYYVNYARRKIWAECGPCGRAYRCEDEGADSTSLRRILSQELLGSGEVDQTSWGRSEARRTVKVLHELRRSVDVEPLSSALADLDRLLEQSRADSL